MAKEADDQVFQQANETEVEQKLELPVDLGLPEFVRLMGSILSTEQRRHLNKIMIWLE